VKKSVETPINLGGKKIQLPKTQRYDSSKEREKRSCWMIKMIVMSNQLLLCAINRYMISAYCVSVVFTPRAIFFPDATFLLSKTGHDLFVFRLYWTLNLLFFEIFLFTKTDVR